MQAKTTVERLTEDFRFTLSKFSHEIRNPIALINSELQMIASTHPEIAASKCWTDIMENLEYIKALLNELSDYSNAGNLCLTPTDSGDYLRSVTAIVKPTLDYLGITLETNISSDLPTLPLDRIKMRQALLNLLRNAQESLSGPNGKILVSAVPLQQGICITIRDNGCGMDSEQLETVFLPFVTYKPGGTGLGLAITKQIIEAHGGRLEADSTPHQGTVLRILLG